MAIAGPPFGGPGIFDVATSHERVALQLDGWGFGLVDQESSWADPDIDHRQSAARWMA